MVLKRARRLPQRGREALLTAVNTRMYFGCREKQQEQGDTRKRSFGIECLMEKKFQKKYVAVARFWKKRGIGKKSSGAHRVVEMAKLGLF